MEDAVEVKKPTDWPCNSKERRLSQVYSALIKFINTPNYKNRENLLSIASSYDLKQQDISGLWRITEYEVSLINEIYNLGKIISCNATMIFLYEMISKTLYFQKMFSMMQYQNIDVHIKIYEEHLRQPLRLYSYIYSAYLMDNDETFGDKFIDIVSHRIDEVMNDEKQLEKLLYDVQPMINDISNIHTKHIEEEWCFSRKQIRKIFKLLARMMNILKIDLFSSPYHGVLKTEISNYLLKSRNNYNNNFVVKYMDSEIVDKSLQNNQIWIQSIKKLNDSREGKVLPEIFNDKNWINYKWATNINFQPTRKYFLTCFSKASSLNEMKNKYGDVMLGYKSERIADDICPIAIKTVNGFKVPWLGQVVSFDVLYDKNEIKAELNLLFEIINEFNIPDSKKHDFLEEILQYWLFSIKDSKWKNEQERRYLLFLYDEYNYIEMENTGNYLKINTLLFSTPDYIVGYHGKNLKNIFDRIGQYYIANSMNRFSICLDCLSRNFDDIHLSNGRCSVCGSKNIKLADRDIF